MRDKIFLAFEHADESYTRMYNGAGLGLAICKSLVELHGGWIWLEDRPGSGAIVCVRLPVDPFGAETGAAGQANVSLPAGSTQF